jgi:hypothetical protein
VFINGEQVKPQDKHREQESFVCCQSDTENASIWNRVGVIKRCIPLPSVILTGFTAALAFLTFNSVSGIVKISG